MKRVFRSILLATFTCQTVIIAAELNVPGDFPTIQSALNMAKPGDTVLVAPGVYVESLTFKSNSVTLASNFVHSGVIADIHKTVIDGTNAEGKTRKQPAVVVTKDVSEGSRICGFTIQNGNDGILCEGFIDIDHNRFVGHSDAIDYESGGGKCHHNLFEENYDDAVDLDGACAVDIRYNVMRNNGDDGIEIRLHPYEGEELLTVIMENRIVGNGEDGIQFIDYDTETNRIFVIAQNIIAETMMAGIGFMSNAVTKEDYRAAQVFETVWIFNNTFSDNAYGITGNGKGGLQNNVFVRQAHQVFQGTFAGATVANNLLWDNGATESYPFALGSLEEDPGLDVDYVSLNTDVTNHTPLQLENEDAHDWIRFEVGVGATPDGKPVGDEFWMKQ